MPPAARISHYSSENFIIGDASPAMLRRIRSSLQHGFSPDLLTPETSERAMHANNGSDAGSASHSQNGHPLPIFELQGRAVGPMFEMPDRDPVSLPTPDRDSLSLPDIRPPSLAYTSPTSPLSSDAQSVPVILVETAERGTTPPSDFQVQDVTGNAPCGPNFSTLNPPSENLLRPQGRGMEAVSRSRFGAFVRRVYHTRSQA